jgi:hypothetical protein
VASRFAIYATVVRPSGITLRVRFDQEESVYRYFLRESAAAFATAARAFSRRAVLFRFAIAARAFSPFTWDM